METGIKIKCDGSVKFWEKPLNASPKITDSTSLSSKQMKIFSELMNDKEIFTYKNDYTGNYTGHLTLTNDEANNSFSFNPSDLPKDMPKAIVNLISEIKKISNNK